MKKAMILISLGQNHHLIALPINLNQRQRKEVIHKSLSNILGGDGLGNF